MPRGTRRNHRVYDAENADAFEGADGPRRRNDDAGRREEEFTRDDDDDFDVDRTPDEMAWGDELGRGAVLANPVAFEDTWFAADERTKRRKIGRHYGTTRPPFDQVNDNENDLYTNPLGTSTTTRSAGATSAHVEKPALSENGRYRLNGNNVGLVKGNQQNGDTAAVADAGRDGRCLDLFKGFCSRCKKKPVVIETERRVTANNPGVNASYEYVNNFISTSKYNVITFLPKNLFEQFRRIANTYFLVLMILQLMPWISSLTWVTTVVPLAIVLCVTALKDLVDDLFVPEVSSLSPPATAIPLVFVLLVSAIKDGHDDIQRHRSDNQVNSRLTWVLRDRQLVKAKWSEIVVGDILKLENDEFVTADMLLLSSSEPNSLCYIETAELDGETNLKVRQALVETSEMNDNVKLLSQFDGEVVCEPPNNVLSKFEGTLTWRDETYALDNDKILLRGCVVRNTRWCFGLVLFAGADTKLMMNCGKTTFKRTHIDRLMNRIIIGIFLLLVTICLMCTIGCGIWNVLTGYKFQIFMPWDSYVTGSVAEGGKPNNPSVAGSGSAIISILTFFSYLIILNTLVPISLYVSVELIRLVHSFWINWDARMYYEIKDTPAKARTTTLNEELGQIEYIFSDKTGTLTQNIMTFNKCSINGRSYGDAYDQYGNPVDVTEVTATVDFSSNPHAQKEFRFYDGRLLDLVKQYDNDVHQFFRLLALCHTVMPEYKNGQLVYQAQSPDEGALVNAARNFGFVFRSRTANSITIEVLGKTEVYDLLCILDFNNVRKRMSVILRKDNKIMLYCKGADTTVYERIHQDCANLMELTTSNLNDFAQTGLRTLCLAAKEIDPAYYAEWKKRHHAASTSLVNRDDQLDAVYEEIEKGMLLLGATAIEDKLQDGVPEAIANLALAGIKIWVLTGDKQETAINIGYSSRLLTEDMEEVYIIDGETAATVSKQLQDALKDIAEKSTDEIIVASKSEGKRSGRVSPLSNDSDNFALVVNGCSLVHALKPEMELLLLDTASRCRAVICCRVTPLQKALVVELVKRNKKSITLAIGDGANDVSMIKSAHIGVGISGQEGMQAVLASDYSMAQFAYLERLLLVHGRWSYIRMCKFLKYFFYKNFSFTLCHMWFAFFCGFSAQTIYDPYFISLYNVVYTSLPVLMMGIFDQALFDEAFISLYNVCYTSLPVLVLAMYEQDVNDKLSLEFPKLYAPGQQDRFFNKKVFLESVVEGIITSLFLFMLPYGAFNMFVDPTGKDIADLKSLGFTIASILIVVVTLRCGIETTYWTGFNHFVIWGSILFYFAFINAFYSQLFGYSYIGTATKLMSTASFWFTMILTVVVLLAPVVLRQLYSGIVSPTLTDKVRLRQKLYQPSVRGPRVLRRASSARGVGSRGAISASRRSMRSGFAFAQQPGYGELITSGSMMQMRPRPRSTRAKRPPPPPAHGIHQAAAVAIAAVPVSASSLQTEYVGMPANGSSPVPRVVHVAESEPLPPEPEPVQSELPDASNESAAVADDDTEQTIEPERAERIASAESRLSTGDGLASRRESAFNWGDQPEKPASTSGIELESRSPSSVSGNRPTSADRFYDQPTQAKSDSQS